MTVAVADALGGRLKLLSPSELSPDQKRTYDTINTEMVALGGVLRLPEQDGRRPADRSLQQRPVQPRH